MVHGSQTIRDKLGSQKGKSPDLDLLRYMASNADKEDKVFENQMLIKMPVVRNGKKATVGYCPEIWSTWE